LTACGQERNHHHSYQNKNKDGIMFSTEFLITSLVVVLIPGTGVIYTVSTGLFQGRRASIFAAMGCTLGIVPHLLFSILGLSAILHTSALVFQAIKYAGVLYLSYLAWATWKDSGAVRLSSQGPETSAGQTMTRGILINILNPKLSIFFLAFLPLFISTDATTSLSPTMQLFGLSSIFMLMTLIIFILYGLLATMVRAHVLNSPTITRILQRSFAVIFAGLGLKLALTSNN
jgi:threonine/homoserine/homoserine lactone efflux protein